MLLRRLIRQLSLRPLTLLVLIALLAAFLFLALNLRDFTQINMKVNVWSASVNTGAFTSTAKLIATLFDTESLAVFSVVIAVVLFIMHSRKGGVMLLGAMAFDALLVAVTKTLIHSPRPMNMLVLDTGYSFPSGHVTGSVVFFGVLTYISWKSWNSIKARVATGGMYVAITTVVGFDRIYLNVHWFSDVIGGVFLGGFWVLLVIVAFESVLSNNRIRAFASKLNLKQLVRLTS